LIFWFFFWLFVFGQSARSAAIFFFGVNRMPSEVEPLVLTKFTRQAADLGAVYLYQEGLFVRAYNEGAYGFIHQVLACKPLRRFVKSAGTDRVVCGVPLTLLRTLPGFVQASQLDALIWRWPLAGAVDRVLYDAWRVVLPLQPSRVEATPALPVHSGQAGHLAQALVNQLLQFNLATSSPLAALNLVANLQQQWHSSQQESEVA
jgi:hypothetical protein